MRPGEVCLQQLDIRLFTAQNNSAVYMAEFVCGVKQFKLRACPAFRMLKEMYFLVVIGTV